MEMLLSDEYCILNDISLAQKGFGKIKDNKLYISLYEALYLIEHKGFECVKRKKKIRYEEFVKYATKKDKEFMKKYVVYRDLRNRGYVVKSGLKFGADFRVYDKGGYGKEHSKWVVIVVSERKTFTWNEFVAKNRVAHSTRKKLLIAIVDDELDITYYEVRWMRM